VFKRTPDALNPSFSRIAWGKALYAIVTSDISDGTSPAKATRKIADMHTQHKKILAKSRLFYPFSINRFLG